MRYFPINLDVRGRKAVVVGGGRVALRKVTSLLKCGARVTVVSPAVCGELADLDAVARIERGYRTGDAEGACLVISATDDDAVNRQVWEDATAAAIPCNVVDQPELCSFTLPAVLTRGDLTIAVSTGGLSPALAGRVRRQLEHDLSPVFATHLRLLAEMRPRVKASALPPEQRSALLKTMAGEAASRTIERDGEEAARHYLAGMLGNALAKDQTMRGTGQNDAPGGCY